MTPGQAFGIKVGGFIVAVAVIVLIWFLIGHAIAVVVLAVAVIALVYRMVLIHRHTRGGQQM
jgi:Flp pilus assembly protein TadB